MPNVMQAKAGPYDGLGKAHWHQAIFAEPTTMSSSLPPVLPPELLDEIVDHLHDQPTTLSACCVVSKSWVPRARRHLFFRVKFGSASRIESWKKAFPDPSSSPAHHVRILILKPIAGSWFRSFHHIEGLQIVEDFSIFRLSHFLLHGLSSPTLKTLYLQCPSAPPQEILELVCSFPLLENLSLHLHKYYPASTVIGGWDPPSNFPKFIRSLHLSGEGVLPVTHMLLRLPANALRFSKIEVLCNIESAGLTTDLVLRNSATLETLCIGYYSMSMFLRCLWLVIISLLKYL